MELRDCLDYEKEIKMNFPDLGSIVVYGVPWMVVGAAAVFVISKYLDISVEAERLFTAGWSVLGYFITQNVSSVEEWWPSMPNVLPQILIAVLIFGSVLGFQPGDIVAKFNATISRRRRYD